MVQFIPINLTFSVSTTVIDSVQIERADVLTRYYAWQAGGFQSPGESLKEK
ncbi:hypothetical protein [Coleofasciculus chthonoplastes]|uniref:hypothetical protein n=1 Tax=Coleofasciculus chthonoplastes TaxID=64178 RepID=UPI0032F918D1